MVLREALFTSRTIDAKDPSFNQRFAQVFQDGQRQRSEIEKILAGSEQYLSHTVKIEPGTIRPTKRIKLQAQKNMDSSEIEKAEKELSDLQNPIERNETCKSCEMEKKTFWLNLSDQIILCPNDLCESI